MNPENNRCTTATLPQRKGCARGIRNNNPGNIRLSEDRWHGQIEGADKAFCTFQTMFHGIRALMKLLLNYHTLHGLSSVEQIIRRYAPANENHTGQYIDFVCGWMGVNRNYRIGIRAKPRWTELAAAICFYESRYHATPEELSQAYDDAMQSIMNQ